MRRATWCGLLVLALLALAGCGESGPTTFPVSGKVVFADGDVKKLAGSNVEFQMESDRKVMAYGAIAEDGTFSMQMLYQGKQVQGVVEGAYRARIQLTGEDGEDGAPPKNAPIHPRFLSFDKSRLSFKVPAQGDITVKVSRR